MRGPCGRPERLAAPFSARGHRFRAARSLAPNHTARVLLGFNRGPSHGDRARLWVFSFNTWRRARKTQEQSVDGRPLGVQPLAAEIGDRCTRAGPPREALGQGSRDAGRPDLSDRAAATQTHLEHALPRPPRLTRLCRPARKSGSSLYIIYAAYGHWRIETVFIPQVSTNYFAICQSYR